MPLAPAVFSAWGMLMSDLASDFSLTNIMVLEESYAELEKEARETLSRQHVPEGDQLVARSLDLRYLGQEHVMEIPIDGLEDAAGIREHFEELHKYRYGHVTPDAVQAGKKGERKAYCFALEREVEFGVYERSMLNSGDEVEGPAIIEEGTSTTVIYSDQKLHVNKYGHLVVKSGV